MPKCLITGGAGFIGSHLAVEACSRGWDVTVLDNLSTGKLSNLNDLEDGLSFSHADVRDPVAVARAAQGMDCIFHLAALVSVPVSMEQPRLSAEINDLGTMNVLEAARSAGVGRVVLSSSAAVYGESAEPPHEESMTPQPMSPYAVHKLAGEYYGRIYTREFGVDVVSLRYFNVYGPRQDPKSPYSGVISIFADKLAAGATPVIYGDGEQTRDFVYVSDVVDANLAASTASGCGGMAINVGTGVAVSINELWRTMAAVNGSTLDPEHGPARGGEVRHSVASVDAAARVLGFRAGVGLKEGLAATLGWIASAR